MRPDFATDYNVSNDILMRKVEIHAILMILDVKDAKEFDPCIFLKSGLSYNPSPRCDQ